MCSSDLLAWWEESEGSTGGRIRREARSQVGDLVLRRADGYLAYHLATAVDELSFGITEVVRGEDLLEATAAQVAVCAALGQEPPAYWHVPLWLDASGRRLSKRDADGGVGGWRNQDGDASALVGMLAASLGLVPENSRLSAAELLQTLEPGGASSLRKLLGSRGPVAARVIPSPSDP